MSKNIYIASQEFVNKHSWFGLNPTPLIEGVDYEPFTNTESMKGILNPMYGMTGEKNPNFHGHLQTEETRKKISENNAKVWLGKTGKPHPKYGRKYKCSPETAEKISKANKGNTAWNKGKTGLQKCSDETKKKMSLAKIGKKKPKIECLYCNKIGGIPQMKQWHFDNCKEKK
jgi:hypothetical protein